MLLAFSGSFFYRLGIAKMTDIQLPLPPPALMKPPALSAPDLTRFYIDSSVDITKPSPPLTRLGSVTGSSSDEDDDDDNNERKHLPSDVPKLNVGSPSLLTDFLAEKTTATSTATSKEAIAHPSVSAAAAGRRKLNWKFKGLTLFLELEEFDNDITNAIHDFSSRHDSPLIPQSHTTAIYGMEHLTVDDACERLRSVRQTIPHWPAFDRPTGIISDVSEDGQPGQVCTIAWAELTLATSPAHEAALDELHRVFFKEGECYKCENDRDRPWKPHNSIAYDNPETNALSLSDTVSYLSRHPTLLDEGRRVEAISLWNTEGRMDEWVCLDRVRFW